MAINKVNYGGQTLIDTSGDTAEAGDVLAGQTFHSRSGTQETGTMITSPKILWYGTCDTAASSSAKTVSTLTGDFSLSDGNILYVKMTNSNTGTDPTLNVDGTGAKSILRIDYNTTYISTYFWQAGEVVAFIYNGTNFVIVEGGVATTAVYGVTKLSSSTSSTSTSLAATPSAVKQAYDIANDNASKIEALTTVESYTPTWASTTGCADCRVSRCGCIGQIYILNISKLAKGSNIAFTLPEGWRPNVDIAQVPSVPSATISNGSTLLSIRIIVHTNGQVELYNYRSAAITSGTNASIGFAYIIDRTI